MGSCICPLVGGISRTIADWLSEQFFPVAHRMQIILSKRWLIFVKVTILIGLFGTFAWIAHFNQIAEYDETLHLDIARNIYQTGLPIRSSGPGEVYLYHPPLFLYLLAPATGPLADGTLPARFISGGFGLLVVALVFRLGTDLKHEIAGLIAGLLVAISPLFQIYAFNIQAEVMLTALILAGLLTFGRAWRYRRAGYAWLAGLMFGLALWVKFLAVLPVAACVLFWLLHFRQRRDLKNLLALIGPVILALVAWTIFGFWLDPTMFWAVMRDWFSGPDWPWDGRTHFTLSAWLMVVVRDVLSYPGAILLLATLPWRWPDYRRNAPLLLLEIYGGLMWLYTFLISVKEVRHLIPLWPVAAILIGCGLVDFWRGVPRATWPAWGRVTLTGLALILLFEASPLTIFPASQPAILYNWFDPPYALRVFHNDPYLTNVRQAGYYLRQVTPSNAIITVVHEGTVAGYYANRHYWLLYVLPYDQTVQVLTHSDWLLVDKEIYPNLTSQEFKDVKAYIAGHFAPVTQFHTAGAPATIYQRVTNP